MRSARSPFLSDYVLNAVFLQAIPGFDRNILNEMNDAFGQKPKIYVGLGRYDLIAVEERTDLGLVDKFYSSNLTNVKDWLPVWGLRWAVGDSNSDSSSETRILGLSFVKLDLDYALNNNKEPIEEEESLAQKVISEGLGIPYCCLGFNELLILNYTKSFSDLSDKILSLKKALVDQEKKTPRALDICTIPAIEYEAILDRKIRQEMKDPVKVDLFLSLQIGLDDRFKVFLRNNVEFPLESSFGAHDVTVKLSGTSGEVISKIEQIRNEGLKYGLYSSFTMIKHPDIDVHFDIPRSQLQPNPANQLGNTGIKDEKLDFYKTWVQASIGDRMTRHVFTDQISFFKNNDELKRVAVSNPQAFGSVLECVRIGFEQRCSALDPGNLLGAKSIRTENLGSLQRVTMAIESLPVFLFEKLKFGHWPGFCIHGYIGRFYRTPGGIINIPYKFRIKPEYYWGILHEVGHELFLKIEPELKERLRDELKGIIDRVIDAYQRQKDLNEGVLQEDYTDFAEEIFAELFGFHFGFNDNWELYVSKVWSYFAQELELDYLHLTRSVLAYFTFGPGKRLARDQITFREIDKCIERIAKATKDENGITIDSDEGDRTIPIALTFLNTADIIREYFMLKPTAYDNVRFRHIRNVLKTGRIYCSDNPLEILFAFSTSKYERTYSRRFAEILSLYNCYCKNLKELEVCAKDEQS